MEIVWVSEGAAPKRFEPGDVGSLLRRTDGFVWVDVPELDDGTAGYLAETFGFHAIAFGRAWSGRTSRTSAGTTITCS